MNQPRAATPSDLPEILRLIVELAVYEREPDAVKATVQSLQAALFGENPAVFAHVIDGAEEGTLSAISLWYLTFSTWEGVHGIHLEDLYVQEADRGNGYGKTLLTTLAALCVERGYKRLEWCVLNWNTPAIGFYESLGAAPMSDWSTFRLDGDALSRLG